MKSICPFSSKTFLANNFEKIPFKFIQNFNLNEKLEYHHYFIYICLSNFQIMQILNNFNFFNSIQHFFQLRN